MKHIKKMKERVASTAATMWHQGALCAETETPVEKLEASNRSSLSREIAV